MSDKAWKRHESDTAKYFGVERRARGADFSVSDVEVLVNIGDWIEDPLYSSSCIIVECKYRSKNGIITLFNKMNRLIPNKLILRVGDFLLVKREDFKGFFKDFILSNSDLIKFSKEYSVVSYDKKEPKYLKDFSSQSEGYSEILLQFSNYLPLVCMAKAGIPGRIFSIDCSAIEKFKLDLKNDKAKEEA